MGKILTHFVAAGLSILAITSAARVATASGFATARFGGEYGTVVSTNPTALYYNPGAIGFSAGTDLFLDGTLALRHASWSHAATLDDPTDPPGGEGANAGHARLFNVFGAPTLGATMKLGDFTLGAGLFVPFGGRASWSANDKFTNSEFPLAAAGIQRWHSIDGSLTFIFGTVGAAYRFGPLSVGIAGNLIFSSVSFTQARNPTGAGDPDTAREGRAHLDVSGVTGSFGVGMMLEAVAHRLWIGASYQAQPGFGPQTLKGTLDITSPSVKQHNEVTFTQALPDIVRAGIRWRLLDDVELRAFGDYTRWSVMRTQCIALQGYACAVYPDGSDASGGTISNLRRYWNNTYGVHLSVSHWFTPGVEIFIGAGYETGAAPDATLDPGLADANSIQRAIGGRFLIMTRTYLAVSYTDLQFMNRDNTGASELANAEVPTKRPDGGGQYTQWIGAINVNIERTF
jgi:long-chain fatty acid transport protein